jgi:hypothetical protein
MEARKWLRANSYDDVADLIDNIRQEWLASGNSTRRNWWSIVLDLVSAARP